MKRILCVAEKPSVAKIAARFLSNSKYKFNISESKFNPIFDFTTKLNNEEIQVEFTSILGHIYDFDFPAKYMEDWKTYDSEILFDVPIEHFIIQRNKPIVSTLQKYAAECDIVQLWLDNDREGENIAEEVEMICTEANKNIQIQRAVFSTLSYDDIMKAFNNPSTINRNEAAAAKIRRIIDLRIGGVFTHFQTLKLRNAAGNRPEAISYGPCQLPTLGFVVDSFRKVSNNMNEKCYKIEVVINKNDTKMNIDWSRKQIFCKISCFSIFSSMFDFPSAIVTDVEEREKEIIKPYPLTTAELLIRSIEYLKISSSKTMSIAESLYNSGYVSYPRTETDAFPDDFNFADYLTNMTIDSEIGGIAYEVLTSLEKPLKGSNSDNAHTPIYPIAMPTDFNSPEEKQVFYLICHHFLACLSSNATFKEVETTFDVGGEIFNYTTREITKEGWLKYYKYYDPKPKPGPTFSLNENVEVETINMVKSDFKGHKIIDESKLIAKMNKYKIGTDATFHQHIEKLVERKYINFTKHGIIPTAIGLALISAYQRLRIDFASPRLRGDLESALKSVAQGERNANDVYDEFIKKYRMIFQKVLLNSDAMYLEFKKVIDQYKENQLKSPMKDDVIEYEMKIKSDDEEANIEQKEDTCQRERTCYIA